MIKYNNSNINDWYFDASDIVKVYRNNAVCYYQITISGGTTSQTPCYAVVEDISQYQDTEFEDVFNKADGKWYKLNNLDNYEEYGIYGSGRTITYYEGKLTVDDGYEYQYSGNSWVNVGEVSGSTASLPNVPFTINYNAKQYNSSTKTLPKTSGQLANIDAVITAGTPTVGDGYLTIASGTRATLSGYQTYFNRDGNNQNITIVSKQTTSGNYPHLLANRDSDYNWMYRANSSQLYFHGSSQIGGTLVTTQPVIESVRVDNNSLLTFNNYTDNTTANVSNFSYGGTNTGGVGLFAGYASGGREFFVGDFYWIYMSQTTLTDEQIQQVIDYNEGGGGTTDYPVYYDELQDPPTEVTFSTMEEALAYECPYVGLLATIDGTLYVFNADYEWEQLAFTITGVTTSSNPFDVIINLQPHTVVVYKENGDGTYDWGLYYPDSITNTSGMCSGNTALKTFDWSEADTSQLTSIGNNTFYNCKSLTDIDIPSGVTSIGNYAFQYCSSITSIDIPSGVTSIGGSAFYGCSGLTSVNIPSGVTSISIYIFAGCRSLASINIPSGVTSIGDSAFQNCSSLTSIDIPSGVTSIGGSAFYGCVSLTSIGIPSGVTSIGNGAFQLCSNLASIVIPSSITSISNYTFQGCSSLSSITIPSSVTSIGAYTFYECSSLSSITIPSSVTSIGDGAFTWCTSLTSIDIPSGVTNIKSSTFSYCSSLTSIDIPSGVTTISSSSFYQCRSLTSVNIPSGVTSIGNYAFQYCSGLTSITINRTTPPTLETTAFYNTNNCPIYVPCSSVNAYRTANNWSTYADRIIGFESCTTYNWTVVSGEYICDNGDKYQKLKKQRSFDGGTTYEDVIPYEYSAGTMIESASTDCQYNEYEYIQNQTGSYRYKFNTNFYPTTANTIEIKFTLTGNSIDWGCIICWSNCQGDNCDSTQFRFTTVTDAYQIIGRKGKTNGVNRYTIGTGKTITVTLPLSSNTYTYSTTGGTVTNCNFNTGTFSLPSSTPMHIWSIGPEEYRYAANLKIYYVKVYDANGNVVKHYIPSDSNGAPCFYEKIDGGYILDTYSGSEGGTLTLGPQV